MKYNELTIKKQRQAARIGRGISAGKGKTAGRGTKGQGARKSGGVRPGFEGGQMPLYMRLPHLRGFRSIKKPVDVVYTGQLDSIKKTIVDNQALFENGLVDNPFTSVKLLLKGEVKTKKTVRLQSISSNASVAVQKAGGSFVKTTRQARPKKSKSSA